jgi:hypothetical protein
VASKKRQHTKNLGYVKYAESAEVQRKIDEYLAKGGKITKAVKPIIPDIVIQDFPISHMRKKKE